MIEEWRPVVGYEGFYEVSDHGNVRSLDRTVTRSNGRKYTVAARQVRAAVRSGGYLGVSLFRDGQGETEYVHRLVLEAFRGSCPPGHEACHWDDDPTNNRLDNLRWDTRSSNELDKVRNGNNPNAVKTHCDSGHEYTEENTYLYRGRRHCRSCARTRDANYRKRRSTTAPAT